MQPRPLITENRIIRMTAGDEARVSLGRAVKEMIRMPMTGSLIGRSLEMQGARSATMTQSQREEFQQAETERRGLIKQVEYELDTETDPVAREQLNSRLDELYQAKQVQKDALFQQSIDEGRISTPEQLTEKFGDDVLTFDEPMSEEEARLLYEGKKEELIRNAIISRSPTGFVPGVAKFGGGMLAMATDPVEVATMFIPFVGQAGKARSIARFGRIKGRAAVGAVEGTAGALLTEPLYYGLSKEQQLDYTMSEALLNVGAGTFFGGGIGTIAGLLKRSGADARTIISDADIDAVLKQSVPEVSVRADLEPTVAPERISLEEAQARADRIVKQTREMYAPTGGRVTYEVALRQFATDQGVDVSLVLPKTIKRPMTLSEFVRSRGGINDKDEMFRGELDNLDIKGRAGYVNNKGNMVNGISNPRADSDLDDMAGMAFEAGYLPERNTDDLVAAIREEAAGNYTFARQDIDDAENWRAFSGAKSDFEAEIDRRSAIRAELEELGVRNISDEEIALVSERMARDPDLEAADALEGVSIRVEDVRAEMSARHGLNVENDPLADFDAAARFDRVGDDIELDEPIAQEEAIIAQMREDGELTPDQIKQLDEIEQIDAQAQAYVEVTEAVTVCVARS